MSNYYRFCERYPDLFALSNVFLELYHLVHLRGSLHGKKIVTGRVSHRNGDPLNWYNLQFMV